MSNPDHDPYAGNGRYGSIEDLHRIQRDNIARAELARIRHADQQEAKEAELRRRISVTRVGGPHDEYAEEVRESVRGQRPRRSLVETITAWWHYRR